MPTALRYPSLPHGFAYLLAHALNKLAIDHTPSKGLESDYLIPISPSHLQSGHYASPIPFMVAQGLNQSPRAIALQLQSHIVQSLEIRQPATDIHVQIQIEPNGWISFRSSPALQLACLNVALQNWEYAQTQALCLERVQGNISSCEIAAPKLVNFATCSLSSLSEDSAIFELQYAHARCHAWLRTAHKHTEWNGSSQHLLNLDALSRLGLESQDLYSAEQQIWRSLLNFPLSLIPSQRIKISTKHLPFKQAKIWMEPVLLPCPLTDRIQDQLAHDWRKVFQLVYGQCRILGESAQRSHQVQLHRIGLMLLMKGVLEFLLTEVYDVSAPKFL